MTALPRFAHALRIVVAAALVVVAGGMLVRTAAAAFDPFKPYPGHTADYGIERARAIRAALPEIADSPEREILVLGSSGVARAFVPSAFEAALGESGRRYESFNLAQALLQPETALAMAKVIRHTYEARNRRLWIALFGISVPELNRDYLRAVRRKMPDQAFTFSSVDVLADRGHTDPVGALGDGFAYLLFGNVRPRQVGLWIEDYEAAHRPSCNSGLKQPPDGAEAQAALVQFCDELGRQFPQGVPAWNPSTRGRFDFGLPATRPMLERLVDLQPSSVSAPAVSGGPCKPFDDIDADAVRMLIAAVAELEAVSDHVLVLRDVFNPALLAPLPETQVAQWRAVAERISREGEAPLLDLNDGTFTAKDFGDRTHLNPLAAERFSSVLAARVRPVAQEHRAAR